MENSRDDLQENDLFYMFGTDDVRDIPIGVEDLFGYLPERCFSIHTFSVYIPLTGYQYRIYIDRFYKCNSSKVFSVCSTIQ